MKKTKILKVEWDITLFTHLQNDPLFDQEYINHVCYEVAESKLPTISKELKNQARDFCDYQGEKPNMFTRKLYEGSVFSWGKPRLPSDLFPYYIPYLMNIEYKVIQQMRQILINYNCDPFTNIAYFKAQISHLFIKTENIRISYTKGSHDRAYLEALKEEDVQRLATIQNLTQSTGSFFKLPLEIKAKIANYVVKSYIYENPWEKEMLLPFHKNSTENFIKCRFTSNHQVICPISESFLSNTNTGWTDNGTIPDGFDYAKLTREQLAKLSYYDAEANELWKEHVEGNIKWTGKKWIDKTGLTIEWIPYICIDDEIEFIEEKLNNASIEEI